jgi:hypothetical protein
MDRRLPQVIGKQAATIIEIREKLGDPEHQKIGIFTSRKWWFKHPKIVL